MPFSFGFLKSKVLCCNQCGYTGDKFQKWERNLYRCPSCDALLDFGFSNDEQNLLSAAQSTLRRQEFDKAEELFADILERYPDNHEARFGYVCARYGIKHEEDYNGKIIPTCCLDSIASFQQDKDFKRALATAPADIAKWYQEQADYIERISEKWMTEARKEAPYDIFICFKDSDKENGIERTKDSYEAGELYAWLTAQGYRVFFSRISLANKTGEKYEPFIFNALQTAKVLIVFGSKVEYITSTWMKNEWHRYCKRISLGEKKENSLVVVYKDLNPSELPSILAAKQCLNFASNQFYLQLQKYLDGFFKTKKQESITPKQETKQSETPSFTPIVEAKRNEKKFVSALHEHSYVSKIIPGSCITRGYTLHTCECGEEFKDTFTPLGEHKFTLSKEIAPTCTENGKKEYTCSVCAEKKSDSLPAKGHQYGDWLTQTHPECEREGVSAKQCKVCGDVQTKPIPAVGHKFGNWVTDRQPSCEAEGRKIRQCSNCGKSETLSIPAVGHQFTKWEAAKSDAGKEERFCMRCGKTETRKSEPQRDIKRQESNGLQIENNVLVGIGSYRDHDIIIPNGVTTIGAEAFSNCEDLTSIIIPDSVTSIGDEAFSNCEDLTSIIIPDSVTSIGDEAFSDCTNLVYNEYDNAYYLGNEANPYLCLVKAKSTSITSVQIHENAKVIHSSAFEDCTGLTSITIPDSVTSIGGGAFCGYTGLTSISVAGENTVYCSVGNCLIEIASKTLILGCKSSVIPIDGSVTTIGAEAFSNCEDLTSIIIPDSVTSIGDYAFYGCTGLSSITIPDSVTSIGDEAFSDCKNLVYNEYDNAYYLGNDANPYICLVKAKSTSITSVQIHENTKVIYSSAFEDCSDLTSVTIPDSVTSIGSGAFDDCMWLSYNDYNGGEYLGTLTSAIKFKM